MNKKISIIIPSKDNVDVLKKCVDSILRKSTYSDYEIIIVENNSSEKETAEYYKELIARESWQIPVTILQYEGEGPFNYSKVNNYGVKHAKGDYILFLNNDMEVISEDWLDQMMHYMMRDNVGAVGAKLYFPDGSIQHAGVNIGVNGIVADHPFKGIPKDKQNHKYKVKRLNTPQYVMAVTGACLLTKKELFYEMGEFDEKLALAYNDVDYCLKLIDKGMDVIWAPGAELYHHESLTRGYEDTKEKYMRLVGETNYLALKWEELYKVGDRFHPYSEVKCCGRHK